MKRKNLTLVLLLLLVVLLIACTALYNRLSAQTAPVDQLPTVSAEAAEQAEDFTVLDYEENQVSLSEYLGKPIVINFWATWCGPCKMELPAFDSAYQEYGGEIQFMMVNLTDGARDTIDGVRSFVSENGYSFPVYFDTSLEAASLYGAYSIPLTVFIDSDGAIITSHLGMMSQENLESYLEKLI